MTVRSRICHDATDGARDTVELGASVIRNGGTDSDLGRPATSTEDTPTAERVQALGEVEMFAGLPVEALTALALAADERRFMRGEVVLRQGDAGDSLLVLLTGALAFSRTNPDGERAVLHFSRAPQTLGEISLLDGEPRSLTVEATEPCRLLVLSRRQFLTLIHGQPVFTEALLRQLGQTVRRLSDLTSDHVFLDLAGRLAKTLVNLADSQRPGSDPVSVEITQGRLAEMVGGSRQSVNQALGGFARRGLLEVDGRALHLLDRPGLRRRARLDQ